MPSPMAAASSMGYLVTSEIGFNSLTSSLPDVDAPVHTRVPGGGIGPTVHGSMSAPVLIDHPGGDLRPRGESQLGEDPLDVSLGGPSRDHEPRCDGAVGQPLRDEAGDLELAS